MAKTNKEEPVEKVISPDQQANSYLKANKESHYNFEETIHDKTRSSSIQLTAAMDGGLEPGAHRAVGKSAGGKTSCTLDFMYHFLKAFNGKGRRGVYIKSEGRLSENVKARSGVKFVLDPAEWVDGTCLIVESQEFEFVFGFMGEIIRNNPTKTRYYFIIDSMDMMARKADLEKGLEDAVQVAGGALITSVFLKKTSVALAKRGHICWFISQVRDSIKINAYGPPQAPRQGSSSGGHAIEHAGDWVLEFLGRNQDDIILEDPNDKNSKPIGHYCRAKIVKSNNEKYGMVIRYPIKYERKNAESVWIEREIFDLLLQWEMIEKKGAWFNLSEGLIKEVKDAIKIELPEQLHGKEAVYDYLEASKEVTNYLYDKFLKLAVGK
jgi:RecA/RadA recombinase